MANRDANYVQVGLGKSTTSGTLPLQIDHVTDRLMVEIHRVASDSGSLVQNRASKDANYSNTMTGASNTSTVVTPLTVKGGVVRVIDSATGDIARTTVGWIEDEKYKWSARYISNSASTELDSAVTRTGRLTLKASTTDVNSYIENSTRINASGNPTAEQISKYGIPLKPSTSYRFIYYMKTNYTSGDATSGANLSFRQYSVTGGAALVSTNGTPIKTTTDWTKYTLTFTTNASTAYGEIVPLIYGHQGTATLVMDAWFDVNSMTLEQVSSITNSGSFPALFYPKVTAVTSTDNIDQSQVVSANTARLGENVSTRYAQQFLPTKKNLTGVIFQRGADTGTFTGTVTISIQANGATVPSGTSLASKTYTNAEWGALTVATDYTALLPLTLTVNGSTTYWIVFTSSTTDDSNYTRIVNSSSDNPYTSGVAKSYTQSTTSWGSAAAKDAYFKTLYSKNTDNFTVSTATQTVSVTAPTTDGWANGTVVDTATIGITPLTLAVGDNAVYYSSNGPAYADGTVDASLQGTFSGSYENNNNNSNMLAVAANSVNGFPIVDLLIE